MNNNVKQLGKNFFYNLIYNLLSLIIPFITTPYISRALGPEKTGDYTFTYSIAYYFTLFTLLGVNRYGNRSIAFVKEDKDKRDKLFCEIYAFQLITGTISSIIYIIVAFVISSNYRQLAIIQIIFVISATLDVNWFFFGIESFKMPMIRNIIVRIVNLILLITCVKNENDIVIYTFIMAGSSFASQLALWGQIKKLVHFQRPSRDKIISHIKPNLVLFVPSIAVSLYKVMDKIMLGAMIDSVQVGYYEYSEKIINMPMTLVSAISTVMLPRMSNLVANQETDLEKKYVRILLPIIICLSCGMCFGIIGILNDFIPWFLGDKFYSCINITQILAPTGIFIAWGSVISSQILLPHEKDSKYVSCVCLGAVINLLINTLLIPRYLASGAAIATLITEFVVMLLQTFHARSFHKFALYYGELVAFAIDGIIMSIILTNIHINFCNTLICILIKILIGVLVYVILTFITFGIIDRYVLDLFIRSIRKNIFRIV